jgi:CRISPR-associated protein Csx17
VLIAAAALDASLSRSGKAQEKVAPCPWLQAAAWVPHLDDGSVEFRLALAFASQWDEPAPRNDEFRNAESPRSAAARPALFLRPIRESTRGGLGWSGNPPVVTGLGWRRLTEVLSDLLARRCVEVVRRRSSDARSEQNGQVGVDVGFDWRVSAPLEAVVAFLEGRVDDARLEALIQACLLLDFSRPVQFPLTDGGASTVALPAYSLLAPFFCCRPLEIGGNSFILRPGAEWIPLLRSGHLGQRVSVLGDAIRRLRIAQLVPLLGRPDAVGSSLGNPERLVASLAFPISRWAATELLRRVASTKNDLITT